MSTRSRRHKLPPRKEWAFPEGQQISLAEMMRLKMSGLVVGTSETGDQVSLCRLVKGEQIWRENYDPNEADLIADEMKRIAQTLRS